MEIITANSRFGWIKQTFKEVCQQKNLLSKWKHLKYRILWEARPYFHISGKYPLAVDIELANACNFRCTMCQQSTNWLKKKDEKLMDWDTFAQIVDDCVRMGVYSMKVNWRGEPMLHPHLDKFISHMKGAGVHEVMMNTNASFITYENSLKIINSGIDRIIFSCDGTSKETYNKIRRGGDFDTFKNNLTLFSQAKIKCKRFGDKVPVVRLNVSIQDANRHQIGEYEKVFGHLVDEIRFNTVYNPQMSNKWLKGEHRTVKRKGCPQIYQRLIVSVEGDMIPCCVDFRKELNLGNVKDVSMPVAYNKHVQRIRNLHENHLGRTINGCRNCDNFALSEKPNGKVIWK